MSKLLERLNPMNFKRKTRGSISLFLAVLMSPFLTIAMFLVETGRFNSAVSILDEALGVSSVSTLANYDTYLQERWGVLALTQTDDVDTIYTNNIDVNSQVFGNSLTLENVEAEGIYPLSNPKTLQSQIVEFGKLNAPTQLAMDYLKLGDIIAKLEKFCNLADVFDMLTSGVDAVDSTITLVDAAEKLKAIANEIDELKTDYETRYSSFETTTNALIDALGEPRPEENTEENGENSTDVNTSDGNEQLDSDGQTNEDEDKETAEEYDKRIEELKTAAKEAKESYSEILGNIAEKLAEFQTEIKKCEDALKTIQASLTTAVSSAVSLKEDIKKKDDDLKAINQTIKDLENEGYDETDDTYKNATDYRAAIESELAELKLEQGLAKATENGLTIVRDGWQESFGNYSDETIGLVIEGFQTLKVKIDAFDMDAVTLDTAKIDEGGYKNLSVSGYITATDIEAYLDAQEEEFKSGVLSDFLQGIETFYNSLFSMNLFYEPELAAVIDTTFYENEIGGLPGMEGKGSARALVESIGSVLTEIFQFREQITRWWQFKKILEGFKELYLSIQSFFENLANFVVGVARSIAELFMGYDKLYSSTYATYNLPCRTDYNNVDNLLKFNPMTGGQITNLPNQGNQSASVFSDLQSIIHKMKTAESESSIGDITFSGAELEYILYGSKSEVSNQLYTFFAIYLFKLLFDIPMILANTEVQTLAAASTFGYPAVIALEIILEPLVETILLANGENVALLPAKIYLTPTGMMDLLNIFTNEMIFLTTEQQESMELGLATALGGTEDNYNYQKTLASFEETTSLEDFGEMSYRQYCFWVLLLTVDQTNLMARLANLIQMETTYYYQQQGIEQTFNLNNSYTYLSVKAKVNVKQALPSLIDSTFFTIERQQYRGY